MAGPAFAGRRRRIGIAVSALLVLTAFVLAARNEGPDSPDASPRLVDLEDLAALESSLGHPVYWAGRRPPDELELTARTDGNVLVRYLPPGTEAGDPRQRYLTVGTYPVVDPVAALRRTANQAGAELERMGGGAVALQNPSAPGSAYLAEFGSTLQVEVYDPAPGRALKLIRSGAIGPVG